MALVFDTSVTHDDVGVRHAPLHTQEISSLRRQLLSLSPSASREALDKPLPDHASSPAHLTIDREADITSSPAAHQRYRTWKSER